MKKLLLLLMFSIVLMGVVNATPTYVQGNTIPLTAVCDNCTFVNLTKVTFPNGSFALLGQFAMTKNGTNYNYTFSDTNTLGVYTYVTCGDLNGVLTCQDTTNRDFKINALGIPISEGSSILYSILLILLILFDLFIVYIIFALDSDNHKASDGEYIGISLMKYLRIFLIGITYGLVLLTLNLMAVVSSVTDSSQFYNIITGLFDLMLRGTLVWTIAIMIWIGITIWKDNSLIKEIKKRLGEGEWGV